MSLHPADRPADPHDPHGSSVPGERQERRSLPYYRLILHAEGVKEMIFAVRTIMELTRLCRAEATHKTWEAHHCGRSLLLITYRERAELYVEQFLERGVTVSIERV